MFYHLVADNSNNWCRNVYLDTWKYVPSDKMVHAKVLRYAHVINGVNARMLRANGPTSRTRRVSTAAAVANPLAMTLPSVTSSTPNNSSLSSYCVNYLYHWNHNISLHSYLSAKKTIFFCCKNKYISFYLIPSRQFIYLNFYCLHIYLTVMGIIDFIER